MHSRDGQSNISDKKKQKRMVPRNFHFCRGDVLILASVVLFSVILIIGIAIYEKNARNKTRYVRITMDGQVILNREMASFSEPMEYRIETGNGSMVIVISSEKVYIRETNCEDKICRKQGDLVYPGDGAVCLPNRVVVQIVSGPDGKGEHPQHVDALAQ